MKLGKLLHVDPYTTIIFLTRNALSLLAFDYEVLSKETDASKKIQLLSNKGKSRVMLVLNLPSHAPQASQFVCNYATELLQFPALDRQLVYENVLQQKLR